MRGLTLIAIPVAALHDEQMVLLDLLNAAAYRSSAVMTATGVSPRCCTCLRDRASDVAHRHGRAVLNRVHPILTLDGARVPSLKITEPQLVASTSKAAKPTARPGADMHLFRP